MTSETKIVVQKWINENLMADGDYRAIHNAGNGDLSVDADGFLDLAELAERIESEERERCAGLLRSSIRYATENRAGDRDYCISMMNFALRSLDPEECKIGLTREQEMKDAISQAVMTETERCTKIAEECAIPKCDYCGDIQAVRIAAKIRSGKA